MTSRKENSKLGAVGKIVNECIIHNRYYVNVHGSLFSQDGTPDILTHDKDGVFTGIEAKRLGSLPAVNQWGKGLEIIRSGGRFIVGYEDFSFDTVDNHQLPIFTVKASDGFEQYELADMKIKAFNQTTEVKLID